MSLDVVNLTFSYKHLPLCAREGRQKNIFHNFSCSFPKGRITALSGDNGSGKTTLARLIMGIEGGKSFEGSFLLDGEDITSWTPAMRGRKVGYLMQNPVKQIFNETVLQEAEYGLGNILTDREEIRRIALEYLRKFNLEKYVDAMPYNLSHGEKQRLLLASILSMKPEYLLLDEPTASLDMEHRKILGEYLREEAKEGCGIVVITHDEWFIREYCDGEVKLDEQP